MDAQIRLCLVLHNHQPIGNFDHVFEQAYTDSYLPFLEELEKFPEIRLSLHTSGPLLEWLEQRHPEYVERLTGMVRSGRLEIIGGAYYEPILTMIPARDRVGQITSYSRWLEDRFQTSVSGMWVPERVWEQPLAADLARADIRYTVLDDFHFRNAGLDNDQLNGYYVTEDEGQKLFVFPGSERLRYLIPFGQPHETIDYLRDIAKRRPGSIAVFGDDGEKFGTWPNTKQHVYEDGWLRDFFQALTDNKEWLHTTTLNECVGNVAPIGKIYLPDSSYREMTEWALPVSKQGEFDSLAKSLKDDPRWESIQRFVRGGFWRNFKVKYPESNEMYSRMMYVSSLIQQADQEGHSGELLDWARQELYRGQCNCSYWHGAFGGIYLPHLRNAVYEHLIAAENIVDRVNERSGNWVDGTIDDYDFDGFPEVRVATNRLVAWVDPTQGGTLYGLDVRKINHNLLATLARRNEAYHEKVRHGQTPAAADPVASIHELVVFKQEGLDQRLQYDDYQRRSLIDHFYDNDVALDAVATGTAMERGDFSQSAFQAKLRRNPGRVQAFMTRDGNAWGVPLKLTKGVTLESGNSEIEISYMIEGLPAEGEFHFAIEMNFAGLPANADDRFFTQGSQQKLGHLGTPLDLIQITELNLVDQWLGIDVGLTSNRPADIWTYPVETVSQSEGGFELVHQSVAVVPHWLIRGDADGKWNVTMRLNIDTQLAESRLVDQGVQLASAD